MEADAIGNLLLDEETVGGMLPLSVSLGELTGAGDDPVGGRRRGRQVNIIPSAFLQQRGLSISGDGVALGLCLCTGERGKISPTLSSRTRFGGPPSRFLFHCQAIQPPASPHGHQHSRHLVHCRV